MTNMPYCRFTNTLEDLRDCYEHMDDEDLSEEEKQSREELLRLCHEMAAGYDWAYFSDD